MIYRVIISPKSLSNWYNAWRWYEKKQKGLGDKFEEALLERLRMIYEDPTRYRKVRKPYREITVIGYPYQILPLPFIRSGISGVTQEISTDKYYSVTFVFHFLYKILKRAFSTPPF